MRDAESTLQQFGEFLLKRQLVRPKAAPFFVRYVRLFLARPASDEPLMDQVRRFCEDLEQTGHAEDWQVRQAEQALRIYFVNFLSRTDRHRQASSAAVGADGATEPLAALAQLRLRIRSRHYSYRTECTYVDWARRILAHVAVEQQAPSPRVDSEAVRNYLTHMAVHRRVSASTQNQALSALLFLCRDVLGLSPEGLAEAPRAKRGDRLPVVLSIPETAALLSAMRGTPRIMARLIYGGGLRVLECCELRIKDIDFDQGLVFVRSGKGAKDRSTLLPEAGRAELHQQLRAAETLHKADRAAGLAGVWMPDALERKYPRAGIVRRHHLHVSVLQKAVKAAANEARIHKPVSVHTLRHCFATHLLLNGVDIRQIQDYLGHTHVETTMIYTHVVKELRTPARSPLDLLQSRSGA